MTHHDDYKIIDSRGIWCPPTPLMDLFKAWREAKIGDEIELWATEPTIESDVKAWARKSGNQIIEVVPKKDYVKVLVRITRKGKKRIEVMSASKRNFNEPDESKEMPKGRLQLVNLGGFTFGLRTLEPGWKWSTSMKPIAKTDSCEVRHMGYVISGRMGFVMDDGTKLDVGPGDAFDVHPGHDAWTIGKASVVFIDLVGAVESAKKSIPSSS